MTRVSQVHKPIAILGGPHAGMILARSIAFAAWLLIPIGIFTFYHHKWGAFYALIAAIFSWLPPERQMLIYMVQVSPDALMAFLFLAALLMAEKCTEKDSSAWWMWASTGAVACLCFLAKQQGIIALAAAGAYFLIRRAKFKPLLWFTVGFLLIFLASTIYFEITSHGQYFYAIFLDLHRIMITSKGLARYRLAVFLFKENLFFAAGIYAGLWLVLSRKTKLTIWQVSFFLHIPFLLKILGNAGGGPNYLATFWITIVMAAIDAVWNCDYADHAPSTSTKIRPSFIFSQLLLLSLLCSETFAMRTIYQDLNMVGRPSHQNALDAEQYSKKIAALLAGKPNAKILTDRNIGAFVAHNANITDEGSSTFEYAWAFPSCNQNIILNAIKGKEYNFIVSGLQPYPANITQAIEKNYRVALSGQINLIFKNAGLQRVYVPK